MEDRSKYHLCQYLVLFLLGTLLVWYVQFLWRRRKLYLYSWKIHGPFAFPIIGASYLFWNNPTEIIQTALKLQEKYPGIMKFWFGPRLYFFTSKAEHMTTILNHPQATAKDDIYKLVTHMTGQGLLTAPVKDWRIHRKVIAPSFNQRILNSFVKIFAEQSIIYAEQLEKFVGDKDINIYMLTTRCTLDIICQTAMGIDMHVQTSNGDFGDLVENGMDILNYRIFRVWLHSDFIFEFLPVRKKLEKIVHQLEKVTETVIRQKIEQHEKKDASLVAAIEEEPSGKCLAFLDMILEKSNFTEKELSEEVQTFLLAGTETSASTLCSIYTMLGMFPEVQQRLYEEILDVVGPDRAVEAEDLSKLKYTERVIKETLRLFPVGPFFARKLNGDIDLGDVVLPEGCSVGFGSVHIHRNPLYWIDPLKFDPDRFLPEEVAKRKPGTYIPFSIGPRNCIGGRYAMMNIKTILATIIRHFRIFTEYKTVEEIELKIQVVLRLKDGPKIRLEWR